MYFSRIQLSMDADPRRLVGLNGYREHQALWDLFPRDPLAKRDFLFRRDDQQGLPVYYLVSTREPRDLDALWEIKTKTYAPQLRTGQVLAFSLRANPVVTRSDDQGKQRRDDLVMDMKKRMDWNNTPPPRRPPLAQLAQDAGEHWLQSREERLGLQVNSLRADGYRPHRNHKRGKDDPIRFSSLDLQGTLTVTDEQKCRYALFHGVGPAKAFGCGLLLVRRL